MKTVEPAVAAVPGQRAGFGVIHHRGDSACPQVVRTIRRSTRGWYDGCSWNSSRNRRICRSRRFRCRAWTTRPTGSARTRPLPRYPRWVGQVEREPFPWSVYRWLEGETETGDGLADPAGTATELAGFISALQGDRFHRRPGPRAEQRVPWCADGRRARLRGLRGARPAQDRGAAGHGRHRRGDGGAGGRTDGARMGGPAGLGPRGPRGGQPPRGAGQAERRRRLRRAGRRRSATPRSICCPRGCSCPRGRGTSSGQRSTSTTRPGRGGVSGPWRVPCRCPTTRTSTSRRGSAPPCITSTNSSPISRSSGSGRLGPRSERDSPQPRQSPGEVPGSVSARPSWARSVIQRAGRWRGSPVVVCSARCSSSIRSAPIRSPQASGPTG